MKKDMRSETTLAVGLAAAALSSDTTGAIVDLQGYSAATLSLSVGVGGIAFSGTNKVEYVLDHSDDGSTFIAVTDDDVLGKTSISSGIIKSLEAAHAAAAVYAFGYRGGKRYVRLTADFSGTHGTATPMAATWILQGARSQPTDVQA